LTPPIKKSDTYTYDFDFDVCPLSVRQKDVVLWLPSSLLAFFVGVVIDTTKTHHAKVIHEEKSAYFTREGFTKEAERGTLEISVE
jgi:hypothetical protein